MALDPHRHTGIDSLRVQFRDLDGVADTRVTYNPGELSSGSAETTDFTVTEARLGDFVLVSAPYNLQSIMASGYVKSSGTVSIRLENRSGSTVNLASGTWVIKVIKL